MLALFISRKRKREEEGSKIVQKERWEGKQESHIMDKVPDEILWYICGFIDTASIGPLMLVSHKWLSLLHDERYFSFLFFSSLYFFFTTSLSLFSQCCVPSPPKLPLSTFFSHPTSLFHVNSEYELLCRCYETLFLPLSLVHSFCAGYGGGCLEIFLVSDARKGRS